MSYDPNQPPQPYGQQPNFPPQQPPGPYGPPAPQGPPPYGFVPPPPAPKKGRLKLFLGVGGGALLLCCGGAVIAAVNGDDGKPKASVGTTAPAGAKPAADKTKAAAVPTKATKAAPPQGDGKFGLKPGTALTVEGDGNTQQVTVRSVKSFKKACKEYAPKPDNGTYLVVDVSVQVTDGTASINPLNFTWVSDDGTTSNGISGAFSGCAKNSLEAVNDLRAGQRRAGQVVFDVNSAKGSVEFAPDLFSSAVGSWSN